MESEKKKAMKITDNFALRQKLELELVILIVEKRGRKIYCNKEISIFDRIKKK